MRKTTHARNRLARYLARSGSVRLAASGDGANELGAVIIVIAVLVITIGSCL
jgi:hypothetical protein